MFEIRRCTMEVGTNNVLSRVPVKEGTFYGVYRTDDTGKQQWVADCPTWIGAQLLLLNLRLRATWLIWS